MRAQTYDHWELCIADDASTDPQVAALLEAAATEDSRIRWVRRPVNGHISEASNSALALAGGDWVALMDHDDLLAPDALLRVAHVLHADPAARMVYSDEDKIDATGRRYNPYFKPDWNPELFCSQNMFSHLGVYRRALVLEVGGFRKGFEGAQDYDLALRCIERIDPAAGAAHPARALPLARASPRARPSRPAPNPMPRLRANGPSTSTSSASAWPRAARARRTATAPGWRRLPGGRRCRW